jgi:hypothetical protein
MTSSMPPEGSQPEYLEQGGGAPLPRESRSPGAGRRKAVLAGAGVLGLAVIGGGVWAAASFFGTGAQPAEALPASTLGYASIDLDPSGGQKIEALRMLNEFPAYRDEIGLDADDDIKRKIFDEAEVSEACDGLDYASDIEPWLGDRAAIAAVDLGKEQPVPVAVLQVKDADAASDALARIRECAGEDTGGWAVAGDWAVVAETEALADEVSDEAAKGTLAEDETFQQWTVRSGVRAFSTSTPPRRPVTTWPTTSTRWASRSACRVVQACRPTGRSRSSPSSRSAPSSLRRCSGACATSRASQRRCGSTTAHSSSSPWATQPC